VLRSRREFRPGRRTAAGYGSRSIRMVAGRSSQRSKPWRRNSLREPCVVGSQFVGLLVDAVSDILTVTDDDIQPTPEISSDLQRQFARGILSIEKRMICLIELEALFPDTESEAA